MKNRKYYGVLILLVSLLLAINQQAVASPQANAGAAILIDSETGQVLYDQNMHQRRPPASTTKIMTGILAIEYGNLSDEVTASTRAAYEGGSSIYLTPGETLTLRELVYGLLVKSGNDAAVAIAEHIGGSVEEFAEMMNQKARELGALQTTFKNPNGLPQEGHLTTAYDLAQITRYALENDFFAEVVNTPKKRISWPGNDWDRILTNTNKLLTRSEMVDGVKTGYTSAAGKCLVASASQGGQQLISVILRGGDVWGDSLSLLNYGFNNYSKVDVITKGDLVKEVEFRDTQLGLKAADEFRWVIANGSQKDLKKLIKLNQNIRLPITAGEKIGKLSIYDSNERLLGRVDLIADRDIEASAWSNFWNGLTSIVQTYF
ncbi:D-alanyl-D-alanine carboxypeptidase [Natroniella sulfidigena]|uniref:D-alanyl-D-alanine carboxypeptidase family protein n=1 Tax=Natroniella sulfidigena TaxID=723921 RepID=UPI00200A903E|nr:D-alanyl-D-alanine carboxypeptidase family protein [Natroniella sulfidigena]MCK8816569.1 D-alanyl-D-alanine carboxypeptidase [Natroniella sulfidigena]